MKKAPIGAPGCLHEQRLDQKIGARVLLTLASWD